MWDRTSARLKATSAAPLGACVLLVMLSAGMPCSWAVNVTTYHYDTLRTGWDPNEQTLTPANVAGGTFGFLATVKLPATQLVGHPLIVEGVAVAGVGIANVVYVVDNKNHVWGLDAANGKVLLHVTLGAQVPGSANPHNKPVGIKSTPVIDVATQTLYVMADTYINSTPTYKLHALALGTLKDIRPAVTVAVLRHLGVASEPGVDRAALDRIAHVPVFGGEQEVGVVRATLPA